MPYDLSYHIGIFNKRLDWLMPETERYMGGKTDKLFLGHFVLFIFSLNQLSNKKGFCLVSVVEKDRKRNFSNTDTNSLTQELAVLHHHIV